MGVYDSFDGYCPKCGKEIDVQTKMFDCVCSHFSPGDKVTLSHVYDDFELLFDCYECGADLQVVVRVKRYLGMLLDPLSLQEDM